MSNRTQVSRLQSIRSNHSTIPRLMEAVTLLAMVN